MTLGGGLAAVTLGDLLGAGLALIRGVAWKPLDPSSKHPFSIRGLAPLAVDISVEVQL